MGAPIFQPQNLNNPTFTAPNIGAATGTSVSLTNTSAGTAVIGLSIKNSSSTAGTETILDLNPSTQSAGVRSAQIAAIQLGGNATSVVVRTANGDVPTTRLTISPSGTLVSPATYAATTASAANAYFDSDGTFRRSTSSGKYKTDIETLIDEKADAIMQMRPVWYRSLCESDRQDWSFYGLIAEEVAEIDPRLVFWGYPQKEVEKEVLVSAVIEPEHTVIVKEIVSDTDAPLQAEGVQYDRLVPFLINIIQRQNLRMNDIESRLSAIEQK